MQLVIEVLAVEPGVVGQVRAYGAEAIVVPLGPGQGEFVCEAGPGGAGRPVDRSARVVGNDIEKQRRLLARVRVAAVVLSGISRAREEGGGGVPDNCVPPLLQFLHLLFYPCLKQTCVIGLANPAGHRELLRDSRIAEDVADANALAMSSGDIFPWEVMMRNCSSVALTMEVPLPFSSV
eukprot:CAMPEP_0173312442 /NCGR_PEP_ID=MMETSP1143-20121109/24140_1 /TAXON_ID=483371 /ORGANISM="non described non described, Strain CCMP2298" /LENGTH=178 /DNA_ID=CAMNT_0014254649 /DNA_START=220 /DNA_END=760 /DNA_ORIENTATION=+